MLAVFELICSFGRRADLNCASVRVIVVLTRRAEHVGVHVECEVQEGGAALSSHGLTVVWTIRTKRCCVLEFPPLCMGSSPKAQSHALLQQRMCVFLPAGIALENGFDEIDEALLLLGRMPARHLLHFDLLPWRHVTKRCQIFSLQAA